MSERRRGGWHAEPFVINAKHSPKIEDPKPPAPAGQPDLFGGGQRPAWQDPDMIRRRAGGAR
jgi:hypothetical protein